MHFQPDAETGAPKMLIVEDVCSGLRSFDISVLVWCTFFSCLQESWGFGDWLFWH